MREESDKGFVLLSDEAIDKIIGYPDTFLIKDLFEIMNEVLANRDLSTYKHTLRVAQIAMAVGREAGLSTEELTVLELGCLVHDIGKTAIPDAVLLKPDLFNDQDRRIMGKISEKLGTLPSIYIKPRSVGWPPKKNGECP